MTDSSGMSAAKRALLAQWREGRVPTTPTGITAGPPASRARASMQQKELWDLHRRNTDTSSSNISFAALIDAEVDAGALAGAVDLLARRHETLRTTLSVDRVVWQDIHDEPLLRLETIDLTDVPPDAAQARAIELANELAAQPFDITTPPLARAVLYRLGPGQSLLAVVASHVVADGWSLAIAMQETTRLYDSLIEGATPDLPPLPAQYRDYAAWQWRWMDSPAAREHARYWEKRLRPISATRLPVDRPRGDAPDLRAGTVRIELTSELSAAARRLAQAEQASLFTVLLTAFMMLLRERTGDPLVSVAAPMASRPDPLTHPMIGFFASVVPLCTTINGDETFRTVLSRVRTVANEAQAHQDFALPMYLNLVEPDRDFVSSPMYTANFVLQPPMQPFKLAGTHLESVTLDRAEMLSSFAIHLWNSEPRIHGTVCYARSAFLESTIGAIVARYLTILERVTDDPDTRVDAV
ncbi:condensation domain-containing protein [Micromonospora sp. NPDC049662]|uniref:condensation domain-containing protein n=1 Tax=Micromonospora sp. NPDC049662 TaxID=3155397 RepID=UPI003419DF56